jgi:hypothetical protein
LWTEQAKIKTRGNDFPEEEAAVLESANTWRRLSPTPYQHTLLHTVGADRPEIYIGGALVK